MLMTFYAFTSKCSSTLLLQPDFYSAVCHRGQNGFGSYLTNAAMLRSDSRCKISYLSLEHETVAAVAIAPASLSVSASRLKTHGQARSIQHPTLMTTRRDETPPTRSLTFSTSSDLFPKGYTNTLIGHFHRRSITDDIDWKSGNDLKMTLYLIKFANSFVDIVELCTKYSSLVLSL